VLRSDFCLIHSQIVCVRVRLNAALSTTSFIHEFGFCLSCLVALLWCTHWKKWEQWNVAEKPITNVYLFVWSANNNWNPWFCCKLSRNQLPGLWFLFFRLFIIAHISTQATGLHKVDTSESIEQIFLSMSRNTTYPLSYIAFQIDKILLNVLLQQVDPSGSIIPPHANNEIEFCPNNGCSWVVVWLQELYNIVEVKTILRAIMSPFVCFFRSCYNPYIVCPHFKTSMN